MSKKILFLVAGQAQLDAISYAREMGYYVITCDNQPNNPGHKLANESLFISTYNREDIFEAVKDKGLSAVVNFVSEHGVETAAFLIEKLGLRGVSLATLHKLSNKSEFRKFLIKADLPFPSFTVSDTFDNALLESLNFPLIVKPVDSGGNKGITKIKDITEAEAAFKDAFKYSNSGNVIFEEFIKGEKRINGDCIISDGKIIIDLIGDYVYDSDINEILPVGTVFKPNENYPQVKRQLEFLLNKMNFKDGGLNFEAIIKSGEVYFIEINPRHSGNYIYKLINKAYSVDSAGISVEIALGKKYDKSNFKRNSETYAYHLIYASKDRILKKIEFDENVEKQIIGRYLFKKEGDSIQKLISLSDRVGLVLSENLNIAFDNFKI